MQRRTISNRTTNHGLVAFTTYKMIDWLTKQISKHESLDNNNKEVKQSKQQEDLGRENANNYIRKNERIHYIDDDDSSKSIEYTNLSILDEFSSG
jgi:hypothetical protein